MLSLIVITGIPRVTKNKRLYSNEGLGGPLAQMKMSPESMDQSIRTLFVCYWEMRKRLDAVDTQLESFHTGIKRLARKVQVKQKAPARRHWVS